MNPTWSSQTIGLDTVSRLDTIQNIDDVDGE